MDWKKLALALGLDENTPQDQVAAKVVLLVSDSKATVDGAKAREEKLAAELKAQGLSMSQDGKIVKVAPVSLDTEVKEGDSPEVQELKRRLAASEGVATKSRLSSVKAEVEGFVKSFKVPPAVKTELEQLLSISGKAEALSLSGAGDAATVTKTALDVASSVRKILAAMPGMSKESLSQLVPAPADSAEALALDAAKKNAKKVAARVQGKTMPPDAADCAK